VTPLGVRAGADADDADADEEVRGESGCNSGATDAVNSADDGVRDTFITAPAAAIAGSVSPARLSDTTAVLAVCVVGGDTCVWR